MKTGSAKYFRWLSIAGALFLTAWLVACYGENISSVHFRAGIWNERKVDFGRVPQECIVPGWSNEPFRSGTRDGNFDENDFATLEWNKYLGNGHESRRDDIYNLIGRESQANDYVDSSFKQATYNLQSLLRARNIEVKGDIRKAVQAFHDLSPAQDIQAFAHDRQELIQERVSLNQIGVRDYLRDSFLIQFGFDNQRERSIDHLKTLKATNTLKPHIAYLLAKEDPKASKEAYATVAATYPKSSRAEAALIMQAREKLSNKPNTSEWEAGQNLLRILVARYPKTRFRYDAEGWFGGNFFSLGQMDKAADHYVRQAKAGDPWNRFKAYKDLATIARGANRPVNLVAYLLLARSNASTDYRRNMITRQARNLFYTLKSADLVNLQTRVKQDPVLLNAYLAFRLQDTGMDVDDERKLLRFATHSMQSLRNVPSDFYANLAELDYRVGRYRDALAMARAGQKGDLISKSRAKYVEAGSLLRLGRKREGIQVFDLLVNPKSPRFIYEAATEQLAFLEEQVGNPVRAYFLYRDIGFSNDISFLVDSELSPSQIASLIPKARTHVERAGLKYSLAMRYFRREQYEDAKRVLKKLPTELRKFRGVSEATYAYIFADYEDPKRKYIKPVDPLVDVEMMERYRKEVEGANNREQRAKSLYKMVQYSHSRRNLMYYSTNLWLGDRRVMYPVFWNEDINEGKFARIAEESAYDQECDANTLKFCMELVRRCPRSSYVPKALYTAGVCAESLSRFNQYWSRIGGGLSKKGASYMRRLAREYPKDSLAKSARKYASVWEKQSQLNY